MDFMVTRFIPIDNVKMLLCFLDPNVCWDADQSSKECAFGSGANCKNTWDIPFAQEDPALGHIQDTGTKMITAM